jgi:hypothetical protein
VAVIDFRTPMTVIWGVSPYDGYMGTVPYDGYMGTTPHDGYMGGATPMTVIWGTTSYDGYMGLPLYDRIRSLSCHTRHWGGTLCTALLVISARYLYLAAGIAVGRGRGGARRQLERQEGVSAPAPPALVRAASTAALCNDGLALARRRVRGGVGGQRPLLDIPRKRK